MVRRLISTLEWVILLAGSRRIIDMQIRSVGIDLGKTTFHLVALNASGKVLLRKKFTQKQLIIFTATLQTCLIGMEACSGAHFLGRALREQGHDVKLIPAQFVKPFVKSNKNDFLDAEAIAEAVDRQNMRFVPIKTDDQLDLQAMHRVRDRLVARRTSVINQLRAFLLERGMVFAKTPAKLKLAMPEILENADANLTPRMCNLVSLLWREWKDLEQQIVAMNVEVEQIASSDPACQRLRQIPGIGPLVATAIIAAIGNGAAFHKGREFLLARTCAATALDRRQGQALRHQQARQQLFEEAACAWCPIRRPPRQARTIAVRSLAQRSRAPVPGQGSDHSRSQQVGSHRLGGTIERTGLSSGSGRNDCLSKISHHRIKFSNQGLHWITKTNEQFPTACSQPAPENGLHDRPVYQEEHAAQLIMARSLHSPHKGRIHLRRSVDPLFAFPLQSDGGPYIFGTFE
jgi:transposase